MSVPVTTTTITKKRFSLIQYFKDSYVELKKVTWPKRKEAINSTVIIVVLSIGAAIFLGAIDFGFNSGLNYLISLKVK